MTDAELANSAALKTPTTTLRKIFFILTKLAIIAVPLWYFMTAYGVKAGWWDYGTSRGMSSGQADIVRYVCMAFGAVTILLSLLIQPRKIIGLVLGVAALAVALIAGMQAEKIRGSGGAFPPIHDVSTDAVNPPMFTQAVLSLREATEGRVNQIGDYAAKTTRDGGLVAELAAKGFPNARPARLPMGKDAAFDKALATAKSMGWEIVKADKTAGLIEATAITKWYGFKDDVAIRVQAEGGSSKVDVRSISRIGGRDSGKNGLRVEAYLAKLTG